MVPCHSVDADGVVVEEGAALVLGAAARDVVESAPDRIEAVPQAVDRVIAREHRATGTKQLDERERDLAPRAGSEISEAGDLHGYVLASGEPGHRFAPAGEV